MKKVFLALITLLFIGLGSAFAQTSNNFIFAGEKNKFYYHFNNIFSNPCVK